MVGSEWAGHLPGLAEREQPMDGLGLERFSGRGVTV